MNLSNIAKEVGTSVVRAVDAHGKAQAKRSLDVHRSARKFADANALSYPGDITNSALGYIRYDIYPHRGEQDSHQSYSHINLHMPAEIGDTLSAEWSADSDMMNTALALGKRYMELQNKVGSVGQGSGAGDAAKAVIAAGIEGADLFASKIGDALQIPFLDAITKPMMRRKRRATNPHEAHFFQDVEFRTFEFTHKLIPFNQDEAEVIRKICHWFRFFASPRKANATHYEYPAEWHIGFYNDDTLNPYLPQIYRCVLTGVNINYTGSSTWSMHSDGSPTDLELSLEFTETVKPTRDIIHQEVDTWNKAMGPDARNVVIGEKSAETSVEEVLRTSLASGLVPESAVPAVQNFYATFKSYGGVDTPNSEQLY